MRAGEGGGGGEDWRNFGGLTEEAAQEVTVLFCSSGGEAVVPNSGKAFWEDVEAPAAEEFVEVEFEDAGFLGVAVGPFEEDVALDVVSEDSLGAEGGALDVSRKVAEGGFAAADGLELDVPLGFGIEGAVLIRCQFGEDFGVLCFEDTLDDIDGSRREFKRIKSSIVAISSVISLFTSTLSNGEDALFIVPTSFGILLKTGKCFKLL